MTQDAGAGDPAKGSSGAGPAAPAEDRHFPIGGAGATAAGSPSRRPLARHRRIRRAGILAGLVALGLASSGAAVAGLAALRDENLPDPAAGPKLGSAEVIRTTLIREESLDGVLGYPPADPITALVTGTVTQLHKPGDVVGFGDRLFDVDDHAVTLMKGTLPAWRDFGPGMADGRDVRQFEQGLVDAGVATKAGSSGGAEAPRSRAESTVIKVDDHFDETTEAAVRRFQQSRAIVEDGVLALGEVVFRPGPLRIARVSATLGSPLAPGAPVYETTTAESIVTAALGLDKRGLLNVGDSVEVEMPDGSSILAKVTAVSPVPATETAAASINVRVSVDAGAGLDESTVKIHVTRERRESVLAVPVTALVALAEGGFAVEIEREGRRELVAVTPGLSAEGLVEVEGGIREGDSVLVPQ